MAYNTTPLQHSIPRRTLLHKGRRWYFGAFVILSTVALVAALGIGALTTMGDNWSPVGIIVVATELVLLIGGFVWLALLVTSKRRPPDEQTGSETPTPPPAP